MKKVSVPTYAYSAGLQCIYFSHVNAFQFKKFASSFMKQNFKKTVYKEWKVSIDGWTVLGLVNVYSVLEML